MPTAAITERSVGAAAFGQAGAVVASGARKLSDTAAVDRTMFFFVFTRAAGNFTFSLASIRDVPEARRGASSVT